MTMEAQDGETAATLLGAARALHEQGLSALAVVVALATLALPAIRVAGTAYLLLAVRGGGALLRPVFRLVQAARPWAQLEILLLAGLVAFGKLASVFQMAPGLGLAAMVGFLLLQMGVTAAFDQRQFWETATPRGRRA
jgi:paraquat-inducible protein A